MIKNFAAWILVLCLTQVSLAADDLLSILDGSDAVPVKAQAPQKQKKHMLNQTPLRKLVGKETAEQNIFFGFIEEGEWQKALYQWGSAFEDSKFSSSANGVGLFCLVLLNNELKLTAIEKLLLVNASDVSEVLLTDIKKKLPEDSDIWGHVNPGLWNQAWAKVFGKTIDLNIRSRQFQTKQDFTDLKNMLSQAEAGTDTYHRIGWQLALALSKNDSGKSAQVLASMIKDNPRVISLDLMNITAARILYGSGYLDAAIKYYQKVAKSSQLYLEAQEEIAWAYLRKGEPQNALAISKTLSTPFFVLSAGPEALFVKALGELKICDYMAAAGTLKTYKDTFKSRAANLNAWEKQEAPKDKILEIWTKHKGVIKDFNGVYAFVPRLSVNDQKLANYVSNYNTYLAESKLADDIYTKSISGGSATIGYQGSLALLKASLDKQLGHSKAMALSRISDLAKGEVSEIRDILQKMHVVEAEILSQITMAGKLAKLDSEKLEIKKGTVRTEDGNSLKFAVDDELWLDELSYYNVDVKGACSGKIVK